MYVLWYCELRITGQVLTVQKVMHLITWIQIRLSLRNLWSYKKGRECCGWLLSSDLLCTLHAK